MSCATRCLHFILSTFALARTLTVFAQTSLQLEPHVPPQTSAQPSCSQIALGNNPSLNGFLAFPPTDPWRQEITHTPVDPRSAALLAYIGPSAVLKASFGAELYYGGTQGIPYQVVSGQKMAPITFTAYPTESDPGPMPLPASLLIEGYPAPNPSGDRHALVIDRDTCFLYELYQATQTSGHTTASSGAIFDLLSNSARPYGWTSADAAGLPIFPGLVRFDEVKAGVIDHALRFTLPKTIPAIVPPATHWAETTFDDHAAPLGMRLRLRADFDLSTFPPQAQVILTALKKYGMILADNGSALYLSGSPSPDWDDAQLYALHLVKAEDFEVLETRPLYTGTTLPRGNPPSIKHLTAAPASDGATTLTWQATGASYYIVSPEVGPLRATTVTVHPTANTTYTVYATNAFGQTTATVKIKIK